MSRVRIETELGDIDLEVFERQAAASAGYFLADVRAGRYDGSSFFRIVTLSNQSAESTGASRQSRAGCVMSARTCRRSSRTRPRR